MEGVTDPFCGEEKKVGVEKSSLGRKIKGNEIRMGELNAVIIPGINRFCQN